MDMNKMCINSMLGDINWNSRCHHDAIYMNSVDKYDVEQIKMNPGIYTLIKCNWIPEK